MCVHIVYEEYFIIPAMHAYKNDTQVNYYNVSGLFTGDPKSGSVKIGNGKKRWGLNGQFFKWDVKTG